MTPRDLSFLRTLQDKVQKYNSNHKQINLVLSDAWNNSKNRYDYTVSVKTCLDPSKPNEKKSIDKAISIADSLNMHIYNSGYSTFPALNFCINVEYF